MLPAFFETYVDAYSAHGEACADALRDGAALWAPPGSDPLTADPRDLERLQQIAGADTPRLFEIVELLEAHAPAAPHYHLQILGVRPGRQGSGLGSALIAPILERWDRQQVPAYLEATSDRNRALYERHGLRVRDEIAPPGGPSLWTMWREPLS